MTAGDNLFGRLLKRAPAPANELPDHLGAPPLGLHLLLDHDGCVLQIAGPLRHQLAQQPPHDSPLPLSAYLLAHSTLAIEGRPQDWQGRMLERIFPASVTRPCICVAGHSLRRRAGYCN